MADVDAATITLWAITGKLDQRCRLCGEQLNRPVPRTGPNLAERCKKCGTTRFSIGAMLKDYLNKEPPISDQISDGVWRLVRDQLQEKAVP